MRVGLALSLTHHAHVDKRRQTQRRREKCARLRLEQQRKRHMIYSGFAHNPHSLNPNRVHGPSNRRRSAIPRAALPRTTAWSFCTAANLARARLRRCCTSKALACDWITSAANALSARHVFRASASRSRCSLSATAAAAAATEAGWRADTILRP